MKKNSLYAAYFSLGAFALISQTMILREFFVVVYGNELIFGVLLANWLIGIFAGALAGGAAADRSRDNLNVFVISLLLLAVAFPLAITGIRFLYSVSGAAIGSYISFSSVFFYSALFIIPVSFFIGFAFPVAARVHAGECPSTGEQVHKIAMIYIIEAIGSLAGGIIYTFLLVGRFNPYFIAALIILPLLFSGWAILNRSRHRILRGVTLAMIITSVITATPAVSNILESSTVLARWRSFSQLPLEYSLDSRYQNIAVASLGKQKNLYLNTTFAAVFPNDEDNQVLAAHILAQHPHPKRILVIGETVSGLAKFLLQYPLEKVVTVEIDRQVVETIFKFLPESDRRFLKSDRRLEVAIRDGRKYIKDLIRHQESHPGGPLFDIVFIHAPEPSTLLLNRYYTREFYADLARLVGPKGVVAFKITASENYGAGVVTTYSASIYNTLKSVFPNLVISPGFQDFIFASRSSESISDNPDVLEHRHLESGVQPVNLGLIFYSLYPPARTIPTRQALEGKRNYALNTDERPIAGFYFNKIIGWYGKSRISAALEFFEKIRPVYFVWGAVGLLALRLLQLIPPLLRRRKTGQAPGIRGARRSHILLAVFSGGMSGLALELVLLYTFQNHFGDVYYIIGFIIALFMFGLPVGAWVSNRMIRSGRYNPRGFVKLTMIVQLMLALIAVAMPHTSGIFSLFGPLNQMIIFLETVLIGFAIGLLFPFTVVLYLGESGKTGKTAGIVDAFDHMGAAAGALFVGSLLLPVMGVSTVCYLLALFPLASITLLAVDLAEPPSQTRHS